LSDFLTSQILGACLAEASVTKPVTFFGVSRSSVSKVMTLYTYCGKTSSATSSSCQKPKLSKGIAIHLRGIESKNHRTTAAQVTAELRIHLEDPVQ
jgi:hypothetical protein